jgi:hypothetical protein
MIVLPGSDTAATSALSAIRRGRACGCQKSVGTSATVWRPVLSSTGLPAEYAAAWSPNSSARPWPRAQGTGCVINRQCLAEFIASTGRQIGPGDHQIAGRITPPMSSLVHSSGRACCRNASATSIPPGRVLRVPALRSCMLRKCHCAFCPAWIAAATTRCQRSISAFHSGCSVSINVSHSA